MPKDNKSMPKATSISDGVQSNARRGFALVVALGLMAFLLLLLIALSSLIQVETQRGQQELKRIQARQNALLGLKLALVQIQKDAGPDRVATARADILAAPQQGDLAEIVEEKLFWTGVWSGETPDEPVRWLVSGSPIGRDALLNSTPLSAVVATGGSIADSEGQQLQFDIEAPRISIASASEDSSGHFAYWVSDEAIKARVDLNRLISPPATDDTDDRDYRSSLITAQRSGIEQVRGLESIGATDIPLLSRLSHISQLSELPSISSLPVSPDLRAELKQRFHDLTPYSRGVLANARDGGLRRDLSRMLEAGGDFNFGVNDTLYPGGNRWGKLRDFYQNIRLTPDSPHVELNPDRNNRLEFRPTPRTVRANGDHGLFPLFVQWDLGIGFKRSPDDPSRAAITLQPIIAVANPYDVPLVERRYVVCSTSTGSIDATRSWTQEVDEDGNVIIVNGTDGAGVPRRNIIIQLSIEGEPVRRRQKEYYQGHPDWEWTDRLALQTFLPDFQYNHPDSSVFEAYNELRFSFTASFEPGEIKWFSLPATGRYTNWPIVELEPGMRVEHYVWNQPEAGIDEIPDLILPDGIDSPLIEVSLGFPGQLSLGLYLYGDAPPQDAYSPTATWRTWANSGGDGSRVRSAGDIAQESLLHTIHAMRPAARFSSTPVPLSEGSINLFTHVARVRGSTETRGPLAAAQIGSKTLSHYNLRAGRSSFFPLELYYSTTPAFYIAFHNDSQFQETEIWEPDAFDAESFGYSVSLFHVPRQPVQSIGMLQHANLSGPNNNVWTATYQVGTSLANPHLPPQSVREEIGNRTIIDHPYMLNEVLWDSYFFSASDLIDSGEGTVATMTNPRIAIRNDILPQQLSNLFADSFSPAALLMINGSFNINSTSVEAWKAVLSGLNRIDLDFTDAFEGRRMVEIENAILRSPYPAGASDTSDPSLFWRGFRELSNLQVTALAESIVEQVRLRGPFLSLAEFVNRTPNADNIEFAKSGPLQAALDAVSGAAAGTSTINPQPDVDQQIPQDADTSDFAFPEMIPGHRGEAAPGWVTQADILSQIGSFISSRSDTFIIRAYGDTPGSWSSASETGLIRAWCEAVVQRLPDYFDPANDAIDSTVSGDSLSLLNETFGRRFRIVAFRWLTEDEI